MSASFKDPKICDRNLTGTPPASSFDSSVERTSGVSSCDESDDTEHPCSPNRYESPWSDRNRKTSRTLYAKSTIKSDGTDHDNPDTDVSDENLKLPPIRELRINSAPEDEALPKVEDLTLDSESESLAINKIADLSLNGDDKLLAGVVTSVTKSIGLIVVKPPMPRDVLLYLGSPVFLKKSSMDLGSKDVKLGWIIDVFGPACEPYYCVKPVNNGIELIHEGTQLFYSPDHPRTAYLCLKREDGNRYTVLYSPRCPGNRDSRKVSGRSGERNLWDNASGVDSFDRQSYRRRYRGNDRGTYGYRNKYRDNFCSPRQLQPKHSYFDY